MKFQKIRKIKRVFFIDDSFDDQPKIQLPKTEPDSGRMTEIPWTQPETAVILKSFYDDKIVINDGDEDEKIVINSDSEDDNMNVGSDVDSVDYIMSDTETVDYNPPDQLNQNVWRRKKKKPRNIYTHPYRSMSLSNAAKKVVEKYKKYRSKKFKTSKPTLNE